MSDEELEQLKIKVAPILKKYGVIKAALFGSRVNGTSKINSDYDLLVEFLPKSEVGLFKFQSFEKQLELILGANVDLATPKALNKYIKPDVLKTMKVIYAK